ncbi:APC family permease [Gordonia sp. NPDC003424]
MPTELTRRLGLLDAVVVGLAAMIGAGVFVVWAPAAGSAGSAAALGVALLLAGSVAAANAYSSARLAARYPASGGTYVYGRERLGDVWGYLAGWAFVVGKTASCAAMALTVGAYLWPREMHLVAVAAVLLVTAVNLWGVEKSARLSRAIVAVVVCGLAVAVAVLWSRGAATATQLATFGDHSWWGVPQAAALMFFAFAGYARITTLGEEVRDPARVIPRAVLVAVAGTMIVYTIVGATLVATLGIDRLSSSDAPLADAVRLLGWTWLQVTVAVIAVLAALGALVSLVLGVSRTTLAMARDGHLPSYLATLSTRSDQRVVPQHAEMVVGLLIAVLVAFGDIRGAIGFSAFTILVYYAIANASAWTLGGRIPARAVAVAGIVGCVLLAVTLPWRSVAAGAVVLLIGWMIWWVRRR